MTKRQIVVIHGGDTFDNYTEYLKFLENFEIDFDKLKAGREWKGALGEVLGDHYEVILPRMPNRENAKYAEWKIWFEKFIPYLEPEVILIGHSLGGLFLAKYLSENDLPKKIPGVFLVAAPYDGKDSEYSLADFVLPDRLENLEKQADRIFLYHSSDDPIVLFTDLEKYRAQLKTAVFRPFTDRAHFNQETFPEIVEDIKNL